MRPKVLILYSLLALIWGSTWLAIKISLRGTPPILGVGLRFGLSALILWAIFLHRGERLTLTPNAISAVQGFI
ncbi:MAG TPA: EamA family transporter, partial [Candidatus Marinimicrobia bacterium]|nr:EamA family transporter [Candidatus Neomarinimicrobiota bacterium]